MSEPFLGQIVMFGGNFAPRGWAFCDGQLLPISQWSALFSILGTTYGGDGRSTFGLPDLRGRVAIHAGNGPGLSDYVLGHKGGAETVTLATNELPSHNHSVSLHGSDQQPNVESPNNSYPATFAPGVPGYASNVTNLQTFVGAAISQQNVGNNQPHANIQPYQSVSFIIALQGIYPSRS